MPSAQGKAHKGSQKWLQVLGTGGNTGTRAVGEFLIQADLMFSIGTGYNNDVEGRLRNDRGNKRRQSVVSRVVRVTFNEGRTTI